MAGRKAGAGRFVKQRLICMGFVRTSFYSGIPMLVHNSNTNSSVIFRLLPFGVSFSVMGANSFYCIVKNATYKKLIYIASFFFSEVVRL